MVLQCLKLWGLSTVVDMCLPKHPFIVQGSLFPLFLCILQWLYLLLPVNPELSCVSAFSATFKGHIEMKRLFPAFGHAYNFLLVVFLLGSQLAFLALCFFPRGALSSFFWHNMLLSRYHCFTVHVIWCLCLDVQRMCFMWHVSAWAILFLTSQGYSFWDV